MHKNLCMALLMGHLALLCACHDDPKTSHVAAATSTPDSATPAPAPTASPATTAPASAAPMATSGNTQPASTPVASPATPNAPSVEIQLSALLRDLHPPTQQFRIDPLRDTVLRCRQGSLIAIPAASLVDANGQPAQGPVTVQAQEFYGMNNILAHDLCTQAGGALLESGGMLHLEASAGGRALRLAEGKEATVSLPAAAMRPGMQLFTGNERNGLIDWVPVPGRKANTAPGFRPAQYPGGSEALSRYFDRNINPLDAPLGKNTRYKLQLKIAPSGIPSLAGIEPAAPPALERSVRKAVAELKRWTPATRAGIAVEDTCSHYLSFAFSFGIGGGTDEDGISDRTEQFIPIDRVKEEALYYVMRTPQLGWINCDRFYDDARPKTDFIVRVAPEDRRNLRLAFRNIRSLMQGRIVADGVVFSNVPVGEPVTIFGCRYEGDDSKAIFADAVTSAQGTGLLKAQSYALSEIQARVRAIGR